MGDHVTTTSHDVLPIPHVGTVCNALGQIPSNVCEEFGIDVGNVQSLLRVLDESLMQERLVRVYRV